MRVADFGHDVVCIDKNPDKIAMLERGEVPIYEPGLDSLVEKNAKAGRLHFTTELDPAIRQALAIFIAAIVLIFERSRVTVILISSSKF